MLKPHRDLKQLVAVWSSIQEYQALANKHGIFDIFQDNGGKLLQVLLQTGLRVIPGREGHDAQDGDGKPYELKTMNAELVTSFSTHHHLNPQILKQYRKVPWVFAIYRHIELASIYVVPMGGLEEYFSKWEAKIKQTKKTSRLGRQPVSMNTISINNPKINASFVEEVGKLHFGKHYSAIRAEIGAARKDAKNREKLKNL